MAIDTNVEPTGTGQSGAGTPAGVSKEIPVHIEGEPHPDKLDQLADRAARKATDRQHREDPTPFTK